MLNNRMLSSRAASSRGTWARRVSHRSGDLSMQDLLQMLDPRTVRLGRLRMEDLRMVRLDRLRMLDLRMVLLGLLLRTGRTSLMGRIGDLSILRITRGMARHLRLTRDPIACSGAVRRLWFPAARWFAFG
jgi:hypothetical protein